MTTKILTGTYTSGYTLFSTYSALTITGTGRVSGLAGSAGTYGFPFGGGGGAGQTAVSLDAAAAVTNAGTLTGGAGGAGGESYYYGGAGGVGGAGLAVAPGGSLTNLAGLIAGGAGGEGGASSGRVAGNGGVGGAGVALTGAGSVVVTGGAVTGGAGGAGGYGYEDLHLYAEDGAGGIGGAGISINGVGTVSNAGQVSGGAGGDYQGQGGSAIVLAGGGSLANGGSLAGGAGGGAAYGDDPSLGGDGGTAVVLAAAGTVTNAGQIAGGVGALGGIGGGFFYDGTNGGAGGGGVRFAAGGSLANGGTIAGGAGGAGPGGEYGGGYGGVGGVAVSVQGFGTVGNTGRLLGGAGGAAGAASYLNGPGATGGAGGAGVVLAAGGLLTNAGRIAGGIGGVGGKNFYQEGGAGGAGGAGIALLSGGTVLNTGSVTGGLGGAGAYGYTGYGQPGAAGAGVSLTAGGVVVNGALGNATARIAGGVGVYAAAGGAATVTNYGTLAGSSGDALVFKNAADRLIAEADSTFVGAALGGGGKLELASGAGTLSGLGATGTVSGAEALTFTGFGAYVLDAGTTWTLSGTNTLGANQTLANYGTLNGALTLGSATDRLIVGAGAIFGGSVTGGGGTLELASGIGSLSASGGPLSGFGAIDVDAGGSWTLTGSFTPAMADVVTVAGTLTNLGTIDASGAVSTVIIGSGALVNGGVANHLATVQAVYVDPNATATITNYGSIVGTPYPYDRSGVQLTSTADRLILENGSYCAGADGGGGTLELGAAKGAIRFFGGSSLVAGGETASAWGFGTYVIDSGGSWTGSGDLVLGAAQRLSDRGQLTITGSVASAGTVEAQLGGHLTIAGGADVSGGGTIEALPTALITVNDATIHGGSLLTTGTGRIVFSGQGDLLDGASVAVTTRGRMSLADGAALTLDGAIAGTAQLTMFGAKAATVLTIANAGATLSGGGKIYLSNSTHNEITGQSAAATLINAGDHIVGAGQLGAGRMRLINEVGGTIASFGSAGLTVDTGANTVLNAGLIEANHASLTIASVLNNAGKLEAIHGTLTLDGAVIGAGSTAILAGGAIAADSAFSENVGFIGGAGTLSLAQSQGYAGTISGFSRTGGTSLDLRDIGFVSGDEATFSGNASGGVLTVTDGTHTAQIHLAGDYTSSTFVAASDGHGGTLVTDPPRADAFASAMAGIGGGASGGLAPVFSSSSAPTPTLARPHP